jgi:hypothetical protein
MINTALNPYDHYIQDRGLKFFEDCFNVSDDVKRKVIESVKGYVPNGDLDLQLSRIALYRTEWSKEFLLLLGFEELKDSRLKNVHFRDTWTSFNLQCCAALFSVNNNNRLKIESQILTPEYSKFTFTVPKDTGIGVWRNYVIITY